MSEVLQPTERATFKNPKSNGNHHERSSTSTDQDRFLIQLKGRAKIYDAVFRGQEIEKSGALSYYLTNASVYGSSRSKELQTQHAFEQFNTDLAQARKYKSGEVKVGGKPIDLAEIIEAQNLVILTLATQRPHRP